MDRDTIFVRTEKGEDEVANKTSWLEGEVLRVLLVVDGITTVAQLEQAVPEELRAALPDILIELESAGFVAKSVAKTVSTPTRTFKVRSVMTPTPPKEPEEISLNFADTSADDARIKAEQEAEQLRIELEIANSLAEAEAASWNEQQNVKSKQEITLQFDEPSGEQKGAAAKESLTPAEYEIASAIAEIEAKLRAELKPAAGAQHQPYQAPNLIERVKSKQEFFEPEVIKEEVSLVLSDKPEPLQINLDLPAAPAAKAEPVVERDEHLQQAIANLDMMLAEDPPKASDKSAPVLADADLLLASAKQVASTPDAENADLLLQIADDAAQLDKEGGLAPPQKGLSLEATGRFAAFPQTDKAVLFFELIGYNEQNVSRQIEVKKQVNQLLSDGLSGQECGDRVILDTDDGAIIAFQIAEDALKLARQLRKAMVASHSNDFWGVKVRIGVHYGQVDTEQLNGITSLTGDGVTDAFAVMGLAGAEQIVVSSAYFDCLVKINEGYRDHFKYCGKQKDKFGHEYSVYELAEGVHEEAPPVDVNQYVSELSNDSFKVFIPGGEPVKPAEDDVPIITEKFVTPEGSPEHIVLMSDIEHFVNKKTHKPSYEEQRADESLLLDAEDAEEARRRYEEELLARTETPKMEHLPSAEAVSKFAENEVKQWQESEQRAKESKPAVNASSITMQPVAEEKKITPRARRKPVPWKKIIYSTIGLALVALVVTPFVMPTQEYANRTAQYLSGKLQQPVQIGQLNWRLLPVPALELGSVSVGASKGLQAQNVIVKFNPAKFFSDVKAISTLELHGVQLQSAGFGQAGVWLQQIAAQPQYPVEKMKFKQANINIEGKAFSGVDGEVDFDSNGKFAQAKLNTAENKLLLDITPAADGKIQFWFRQHDGALPWLPKWNFNDLSVKADLVQGGLVIHSIDGFIAGGKVLGEARLNWDAGWRARGTLTGSTLTLTELNKLVVGDVDGKATFQMQSDNLTTLTDTATMSGSFAVRKGTIKGVDVVETMRLHAGANLPGGSTHFETLTGGFSVGLNGNLLQLHQLKMNANALTGSGSVEVNKGKLSGQMSMHLNVRGTSSSLALRVGGDMVNPTVRAAR